MGDRVELPGAGETIAALATPPGRGALAMLRMSGAATRAIGAAVLTPFQWEHGRAHRATLHRADSAAVVDTVVVTAFAGPRSFTGEDMLEISTHGGHLVPALALDALLAAGARVALPGEFTRRAVAHGKMDLLQAEAVADLVDARSSSMHRAALHQMDGALTRRIGELRRAIIATEALVAYDVDFPEEDSGSVPRERVARAADACLAAMDALLATARSGELMRDGALVVLAGAPNSGKSSLFNALLGTARAIVTDVPGTTRDALEARLEIDGIAVRLVDTAGLREAPDDTVERIGIEVASRYLGAADAVLVCGEDAERLATADARIAALTPAPRIGVRTKSDLVPKGDESGTHIEADSYYQVATSAATGAGLGELAAALARALAALRPREDGADGMLTRERHRRAVARARTAVVAFADAWRGGVIPSPVAATHLREAAAALEELIGAVQPDDVLDAVFRSFCVGK